MWLENNKRECEMARDEAEDRNRGQGKQVLVGCMSKNNGKTMKGWKHGGNMMTPACSF